MGHYTDPFQHTDPLFAGSELRGSDVRYGDIRIPSDHKTVVILDHSPAFAAPSNNKMSISLRESGSNLKMYVACTVDRSLWTSTVEAALEVHRIVDEVHPHGSRLVRFVVSDFVARFLTPRWDDKLVTYEQLLRSLTTCEQPDANGDQSSCSIINGVSMAVEALSELSGLQKKQAEALVDEASTRQRSSDPSSITNDGKDGGNDGIRGGTEEGVRKGEGKCERTQRWLRTFFEGIGKSKSDEEDLRVKEKPSDDSPSPLSRKEQNEKIRKNALRFMEDIGRSWKESEKKSMENSGSIIMFTMLNSDEETAEICEHLTENIISRSKIVSALEADGHDKNFAPISHVTVYIVSVRPLEGRAKEITPQPLHQVNEHVSLSVICAEAGPSLQSVVRGIVVNHYDLASTTVTGIPMKEEAQQGLSVNYDVEVFHARRAHFLLEDVGLIGPDSPLRSHIAAGQYDTVNLAWSTPTAKNRWNQYPRCISALPISPATVNSRPSVCLTTFLLSGRNVLLEAVKHRGPSANQKFVSHLLMCHSGRLYIHTLCIGRHPVLDDTRMLSVFASSDANSTLLRFPTVKPSPLLSNFALSDAKNLRLDDFCVLMKECQLSFDSSTGVRVCARSEDYNAEGRKRLRRITRFWPLRLTDVFIYNIPKKFEPLLSVIRREELSTSDVNKCRECIFSLIGTRDSKEPITMKSIMCTPLKNPHSKEEQFRVTCNEILMHLWNYVNHSERHLEVFNMFLQISGLDRSTRLSIADVTLTNPMHQSSGGGDATEGDTSGVDGSAQRTGATGFGGGEGVHRVASMESLKRSASPADSSTSQSRSNSPVAKKARKAIHMWTADETIRVYDLFNESYQKSWSKWKDFTGRIKAGDKPAVLYPNLDLSKAPKKGEVETS